MNEDSMKPMLGKLVQRAVLLAIVDCIDAEKACPRQNNEELDSWLIRQELLREKWRGDIYSIPDDAWQGIDPGALAQNVACCLLGPGGWEIRGVYAGNASAQQIFDETFRAGKYKTPVQDVIDSFAAMGMTATPMSSVEDIKRLEDDS